MFSPYGFPQKGAVLHIAVKAVPTANVPNINACSTTVGEITLTERDIVLLANQTNSAENGVYDVGPENLNTAPLKRHSGTDNVAVNGGQVRVCVLGEIDTYILTTKTPIIIGTTPLVFEKAMPNANVEIT